MTPLPPEQASAIHRVVELLKGCRRLLFITGAGMSADSGLPTYRGIGGLYDDRQTEEGLPIEVLLSGQMLRSKPAFTWKYLMQIEAACRGAKPNRGHEVIAAMERRFESVWVLTQNVDGFHQAAGSTKVIDIHGDLHEIRCMHCDYRSTVEDYSGFTLPPECPRCRGTLRPGVVLFGEQLPARQLMHYQTETQRGFDLIFTIGTTSVFPYISGPVLDAYHFKRPSVEINPSDTEVSEFVTVKIPHGAAATLDAIWTQYQTT